MHNIIDKRLIAKRFGSAIETYNSSATAQQQIANGLATELSMVYKGFKETPEKIIEIGCGTGFLSNILFEKFSPKSLLLNDLCPEMASPLKELLKNPSVEFRACDAECMTLPQGEVDLIASCSTIQWFSAPYEFLKRCHTALKANGILALTTFGTENLQEISTTTGVGLPYSPLKIPEGFSTIIKKEETITLEFSNPMEVLRHLQQTGVNALPSTTWTKQMLQDFTTKYTEKFSTPDKTVTLTYQPITLIAQKI